MYAHKKKDYISNKNLFKIFIINEIANIAKITGKMIRINPEIYMHKNSKTRKDEMDF